MAKRGLRNTVLEWLAPLMEHSYWTTLRYSLDYWNSFNWFSLFIQKEKRT